MKFYITCVLYKDEPTELAEWEVFVEKNEAIEFMNYMIQFPAINEIKLYEAHGDSHEALKKR